MNPVRLLPAGDRAWLLEPDDPAPLAAFARSLEREAPEGVEDVLPAARTALVTLRAGADPEAAGREVLRRWRALPEDAG
ncbi:carboxyltransferase domain-containing protein, partial [Kineococcus sp. T90]